MNIIWATVQNLMKLSFYTSFNIWMLNLFGIIYNWREARELKNTLHKNKVQKIGQANNLESTSKRLQKVWNLLYKLLSYIKHSICTAMEWPSQKGRGPIIPLSPVLMQVVTVNAEDLTAGKQKGVLKLNPLN